MKEPTQKDQMLSLLRQAKLHGWHSSELRSIHHIGDPAKRVSELIEEGHRIERRTERKNGRHGSRYIPLDHAPSKFGAPESLSSARVPSGPTLAAGRRCPPIAGRSVGPILEVSLADVERACANALEVQRQTGQVVTLENAVLAIPLSDQREMAA